MMGSSIQAGCFLRSVSYGRHCLPHERCRQYCYWCRYHNIVTSLYSLSSSLHYLSEYMSPSFVHALFMRCLCLCMKVCTPVCLSVLMLVPAEKRRSWPMPFCFFRVSRSACLPGYFSVYITVLMWICVFIRLCKWACMWPYFFMCVCLLAPLIRSCVCSSFLCDALYMRNWFWLTLCVCNWVTAASVTGVGAVAAPLAVLLLQFRQRPVMLLRRQQQRQHRQRHPFPYFGLRRRRRRRRQWQRRHRLRSNNNSPALATTETHVTKRPFLFVAAVVHSSSRAIVAEVGALPRGVRADHQRASGSLRRAYADLRDSPRLGRCPFNRLTVPSSNSSSGIRSNGKCIGGGKSNSIDNTCTHKHSQGHGE